MLKRLLILGLLLAQFCTDASAAVIKTIAAGATDQSVTIRIVDSTDGTPETGVVFNTSGIDLKYWRHGANAVTDITEVTQTVNGAHTDGGFVAVGFGVYRLDLPDAAVASGVTSVEIIGTVTGMVVIGGTVELSPPANTVAFGGTTVTGRDLGASVLISSGTGTGQLSVTSGVIASNVTQFGGTNLTATGGRPEVNTSHWGGTAVASATVSANATQWGGTAVASARPLVDAVLISGDSTAADNIELVYDDTVGASRFEGVIDRGTAQAATSTTLQLRSAAAFADDEIIGATCLITSGSTGVGQARTITDYVASTDTATVGAWTTTPTGTIGYKCYGTAASSGGSGGASAADVWSYGGARTLTALDEDSTTIDLNASAVGSVTTLGNGSGFTAIPWNASWDAEVQSEAADAINADTGDSFTAVPYNSAWSTSIRSALGLASANLDTQLSGLSSAAAVIDGIVDQLLIGVNVEQINGVTVLGAGTAASPWNGE